MQFDKIETISALRNMNAEQLASALSRSEYVLDLVENGLAGELVELLNCMTGEQKKSILKQKYVWGYVARNGQLSAMIEMVRKMNREDQNEIVISAAVDKNDLEPEEAIHQLCIIRLIESMPQQQQAELLASEIMMFPRGVRYGQCYDDGDFCFTQWQDKDHLVTLAELLIEDAYSSKRYAFANRGNKNFVPQQINVRAEAIFAIIEKFTLEQQMSVFERVGSLDHEASRGAALIGIIKRLPLNLQKVVLSRPAAADFVRGLGRDDQGFYVASLLKKMTSEELEKIPEKAYGELADLNMNLALNVIPKLFPTKQALIIHDIGGDMVSGGFADEIMEIIKKLDSQSQMVALSGRGRGRTARELGAQGRLAELDKIIGEMTEEQRVDVMGAWIASFPRSLLDELQLPTMVKIISKMDSGHKLAVLLWPEFYCGNVASELIDAGAGDEIINFMISMSGEDRAKLLSSLSSYGLKNLIEEHDVTAIVNFIEEMDFKNRSLILSKDVVAEALIKNGYRDVVKKRLELVEAERSEGPVVRKGTYEEKPSL